MNIAEDTIRTSPFLLVDFYADWCEPCKWLDEILKEVGVNMQEGLTILKVDLDKENKLGDHYNVKSVPTLILFKNGVQVWRMAGFKLASELTEIIKGHV